MSDDLDENRSVGPAASAFPKTILVAGIMWIALGSLIFLLGGLGFAAGNAGPTVFWGLIFGIASIYVGVNSVRGLARNMLGNGIGSIVFAMLTLSLTVQTLVRVMDLRAPEDRGSLVVSMLFAGLTTLVAIGFLAAGILAFVGRGNYRTWRLAHKSSKSSTGWAQHRSGGDSSTRIVLIVLACVGGGVLVCGGIVVVLIAITAMGTSVDSPYEGGGVPIRVRQETEQAASRFLKSLCAGDTQAAWDQTSTGFQNRHEEQSKFFADFLRENPRLREPANIEVKMQYADIQQATVPATVTLKSGGKISLLLNLKREMELWKMSDLVVTDELIHVQASNPPEGWHREKGVWRIKGEDLVQIP